MNNKFIFKILLVISLLSLSIIIGCSIINNKHEKEHSLSRQYYLFWSAVPNTISHKEQEEYHNYSVVFEEGLYFNIMAYNHMQNNNLALNDFKEFLSDEKTADGSYRIENVDVKIKGYIDWYHDIGKNQEIGLYEADLEDIYDEFRQANDITIPSLKALNQEQLTEVMKKLDDSSYEIDVSKWETNSFICLPLIS